MEYAVYLCESKTAKPGFTRTVLDKLPIVLFAMAADMPQCAAEVFRYVASSGKSIGHRCTSKLVGELGCLGWGGRMEHGNSVHVCMVSTYGLAAMCFA